jgi:hypothetical protein
MNRADLVYAICHLLGLRPNQAHITPSQSHQEKVRASSDG